MGKWETLEAEQQLHQNRESIGTAASPIVKHGPNYKEESKDSSERPLIDDSEDVDYYSERNMKTAPLQRTALPSAGSKYGRRNNVDRLRSSGVQRFLTAEVAESTTNKLHLPTSARRSVLESWSAVEGNLESLGMDFFLALFEKHPHMKDLFHFGGLATADLAKSKVLKAHASGVMKTVGVALVGLEDMGSLIPVLRNLGHLHTLVGVQPGDYEVIYGVLIDTLAKHVGDDKWTSETENAWELSYSAIVEVMKDPSRHLDVEPADGWALWNAIVCGYLVIVTPFQLANFGHVWIWQFMVNIFNMVSIATFLLDLTSEYLKRAGHLKSSNVTGKKGFRRWFFIQFRLNRIIQRLGLSRFSTWPTLDATILVSFLIQYSLDVYGWHLIPASLYYLVGLSRLFCLVRLFHFFRCSELASLKNRDMSFYHGRQLADLLLFLCYMIHLFGCLHCLVSKLTDRGDASTFSPALHGLLGSGRMLNAYLHTTYWAFVNVAGIGSYDSTPETSLEILFSMLVHLVGAAMYASAGGSIFAILEDRAKEFSSVEEGVASLKEFMQDCDIPPTKQETFVCGYLMTKVVSKRETSSRRKDKARPKLPESAEELPSHLTQELNLFSRAKAIRDRGTNSMSVEFSFVVAESLTKKLTLLPGDYLFQEGEMVKRCVWMIDKGTLEISIDGVSKNHLFPGDVIGLGWLASCSSDSRQSELCKAYLDWVTIDGMAIADVRALGSCQLVMGIASMSQVQCLQHLYPHDISLISMSSMDIYENKNKRTGENKVDLRKTRN